MYYVVCMCVLTMWECSIYVGVMYVGAIYVCCMYVWAMYVCAMFKRTVYDELRICYAMYVWSAMYLCMCALCMYVWPTLYTMSV